MRRTVTAGFIQAGNLYRDVMSATDRRHLIGNIVAHMADGVERPVQERAVALWRRVDPDLGARIAHGLAPRGAPAEADALSRDC
jgi:catalase